MIALFIKDTWAVLSPEAKINMEVNLDLFSLDARENTHSFEFDMPLEENRGWIGFPERAEFRTDVRKEYAGASLYYRNQLLFEGSIKLLSISGGMASCYFRSHEGAVSRNKDKELAELLENISFPEVPYDSTLLGNSPFVYPLIFFQNFYGAQTAFRGLFNAWNVLGAAYQTEKPMIPFFKLEYILREIFKKIGLDLLFSPGFGSDFRKLLVFNNKAQDYYPDAETIVRPGKRSRNPFPNWPLYPKNHVPEVKLQEFLKILRLSFGLVPVFNLRNNGGRWRLLRDILEDPAYLDWSDKLSPDPELEVEDDLLTEPSFTEEEEELWGNLGELEEERIDGEFDSMASLPAPSITHYNKVYLVRNENSYYKGIRVGRGSRVSYQWERYDARQKKKVASAKKNDSGMAFTRMSRHLTFKLENTVFSTSSEFSGKLMVVIHNSSVGGKLWNNGQIEVLGRWHNILKITSDKEQTVIHLDLNNDLGYENESVSDVWYKEEANNYFPALGIKGTSSAQDIENTGFTPRFLFWHGLQPSIPAGLPNYPMASTGNYDSRGNKLGSFALRWAGTGGMYEQLWKPVNEFYSKSRLYKYKGILTLTDLETLQADQKIMIQGNMFVPAKIRMELDNTGADEIKAEVWLRSL